MAATIEVKYFNSFLLKNQERTPDTGVIGGVVWNGSFGIPQPLGGFQQQVVTANEVWYIEESRIRAGYNNTSTDYGVRAYIVEDNPSQSTRFNSMIYSGIFNSRTSINQTNVFSVADDITKSVDPANGSIQKLYAEDTNLIIFQESKVSRALIDKDAIYSAEGGGTVTSSNLVIGAIQPFGGQYGIGLHPESFAVYGYNKYFVDSYKNTVMRLGADGLSEISSYGMKAFFRNEISQIDSPVFGKGEAQGGWDVHSKEYVLSLKKSSDTTQFKTLAFDEGPKGWTSFYSYKPDHVFSVRNNYYTAFNGKIFKHHDANADYNNFYGVGYDSSITFVFNPQVSNEKIFNTFSYEGSSGWKVDSIVSDPNGFIPGYTGTFPGQPGFAYDTSNSIYSYVQGAYDSATPPNTGLAASVQPIYRAGFDKKENKYCANIVNSSQASQGEIIFGNNISGLKGFFTTVTMSTDTVTNPGGYKEIFAVSSDYTFSNGY
jgi:hypothetical protein